MLETDAVETLTEPESDAGAMLLPGIDETYGSEDPEMTGVEDAETIGAEDPEMTGVDDAEMTGWEEPDMAGIEEPDTSGVDETATALPLGNTEPDSLMTGVALLEGSTLLDNTEPDSLMNGVALIDGSTLPDTEAVCEPSPRPELKIDAKLERTFGALEVTDAGALEGSVDPDKTADEATKLGEELPGRREKSEFDTIVGSATELAMMDGKVRPKSCELVGGGGSDDDDAAADDVINGAGVLLSMIVESPTM